MRLARLQQATTLALVGIASAWAVHALRQGRPVAAVVGVCFVALGHSFVLGLEFVLACCVHGNDPVARATWRQMLSAWRGEVLAAPRVFCWQQPFRSRVWADHLPDGAAGRRGVVLIHGFVCNRGVWNAWMQRLTARGLPFVAVDLEPVFGSIDAYVAPIEQAVRRIEAATGRAPVVVAHSMGGLALRRWWAEQGEAGRLHHAITIGSPHAGTWLARFAFSLNGRQMRIGSGWLQTVAAREDAGQASRMTCFYGNCDNIVFPPSTSMLAGADNRHLAGVAHVDMVSRPEPWDELLRRLAD
ncbi:permease [Rubrivivax gelatinosus]|uniref:esterase/lipase family protein n=1 Tax=Rubrivivax gelatinosus TaxID=28068 RepID=UPI0019070BDD|nr:alpha/beta fold hydrolase [Rubrivivax gelatinosus]MBK1615766.1 permease [Rubrivivax gelatinosus]